MIHRIYRLTAPKRIEIFQRELIQEPDSLLLAPKYLSICAADLRYYMGRRNKDALHEKLPMALIHEAVATVLYDPAEIFQPGQLIVPIPNRPTSILSEIKGNYRPDSRFCSSGDDGFLQDLLICPRERALPVPKIEKPIIYTLTELISIAFNAISALPYEPKSVCVCGNGSVGFVTALALKYSYPGIPVYVAGTNPHKLQYFSFADQIFTLDEMPQNISFDTAFECVGGSAAEEVIDWLIRKITPQGTISLLGVSEGRIPLCTRTLLEKGLTMIGNSRSEKTDFEKAISFVVDYPNAPNYLYSIISQVLEICDLPSLHVAFERAETADFKTIIHWKI